MKLKITTSKNNVHKAPVTCVEWSTAEEAYSAGDDNQLISWSVSSTHPSRVFQLPPDLFPVDLHLAPRVRTSDSLLVACADGRFCVVGAGGRVERSVEAHQGAVFVAQWSHDGASLLTAAEDGAVKVWSRSGMLRSVVVTGDYPIYGASWGPDCQSIAYAQGKFVVVKELAANSKINKWKAHDKLILCLKWSPSSELIISGGEDCRYKVWNNQGNLLFSSSIHDNPITSVSWAPTGEMFAVGSYNTLRLCNYLGWSRCLEKPNVGCIYKIAWSSDSTQLAAACATGNVLFAHVLDRHVHYDNYTAIVSEPKIVKVENVTNETHELLEFTERVIHFSLKFSHLVVTTPKKCYIYHVNNWNTPAIFDLKDGSVILLELCKKYFLLVERNNIGIYNYQGKLLFSPRWPNMSLESLKVSQISISSDMLAIRDALDNKMVHIINLNNSMNMNDILTFQHSLAILEISLGQWTCAKHLAIQDKSKDLYIVTAVGNNRNLLKLGRKVECFQWNAEADVIAAIQETQLVVWFCPKAAYNPTLLKLCSVLYGYSELGRNPRINQFVGNALSVRRADGSIINVPVSNFPILLQTYVYENKWSEGLNLCRFANEQTLWACLAVLSINSDHDILDISEEAFANINRLETVHFIQQIKKISSKPLQKALISWMRGESVEPEIILLHNGMVFQAIFNNIQMHNWTRALELALKHKTHLDTVLYMRDKYLKNLMKSESDKNFISARENIDLNEEMILQKLEAELKIYH